MKEITKEDLFKVIQESNLNFDVNISVLDPDELLTTQGLDSLDMASLLFELESAYNVTVSDESIAEGAWKTINKIVATLNKLMANQDSSND